MQPLLQLLTKHAAKSRDSGFAILLAIAAWFASQVKSDTEVIRGQLASIEARAKQTDDRLSRLENLVFVKR